MPSSNLLTIDLTTIRSNLNQLIASLGNIMVMVKGNAYGTDPLLLSTFLDRQKIEGVRFLGVSHVSEGIQLREGGVTLPIFVISAPPFEADLVAHYSLTVAVSSCEEVEALNRSAKKKRKKIDVHLHLNTGMNRAGASLGDAMKLYQKISAAAHLNLCGIMTHFAAADQPAFDPFSHKQSADFKSFLDVLPIKPQWIHAANSGAAARFTLPFCNLGRIGLAYVGFGVCPKGVRPALTLTSTLASIQLGTKGESVGYNRTFFIQKNRSRIGVIPFGYHDGFPRKLSGQGYVLIRGQKAPMIGTICMDFMMIDLTEIPEAHVGDSILLFGSELPLERVADWAGTDVREILSHLSHRIRRQWLNLPPTPTRLYDTTFAERVSDPLCSLQKNTHSG